MHIEQTEIAIVGAGIVGLAIAAQLSRNHDVVVVERNLKFGREASSRNSQVLHAGIYYPPESMKAHLCVRGSRLMYEYCAANNLPVKATGKIVPGIDAEEVVLVHDLFVRGRENGVTGLQMLTARDRADLEPAVRCNEAFLSPTTGIVDIHAVMERLEEQAASAGTLFAYGVEANRFEQTGGSWLTIAIDADGCEIGLQSDIVINSSGLSADRLAATAGIDIDKAGYLQVPCKGEYFRIAEAKNRVTDTLVYPAHGTSMRGEIADGIHLVQELDGSMKIGPNTMFGHSNVTVDPDHAEPFACQMCRYLPWLDVADLRVDSAGVRAMRKGEELGIMDYIIREESSRGLSGLVNLIGMESPALTSCLAIAQHVESLL